MVKKRRCRFHHSGHHGWNFVLCIYKSSSSHRERRKYYKSFWSGILSSSAAFSFFKYTLLNIISFCFHFYFFSSFENIYKGNKLLFHDTALGAQQYFPCYLPHCLYYHHPASFAISFFPNFYNGIYSCHFIITGFSLHYVKLST